MPVTKFFRVATSGRTVDGREITVEQIDQVARTYDPNRYGARIWLEHMRSFLPDNPGRAYGDVLAVKADTDKAGNRVLLAQMDATEDLIKMAASRQKVYWSVEIDPNFAKSGEAYLVGLAITDSPASLGTEMLKFAIQSDKAPDKTRVQLYGAVVEDEFRLDTAAADDDSRPGLLSRVRDMLAGPPKAETVHTSEAADGILAIADEVSRLSERIGTCAPAVKVDALTTELAETRRTLDDLVTKLSSTDANPPRPVATGSIALTDC